MKKLSESPGSVFTEANKIDDDSSVDVMNPVYGMKCQLIRIISNMCYRNKANQDLVILF